MAQAGPGAQNLRARAGVGGGCGAWAAAIGLCPCPLCAEGQCLPCPWTWPACVDLPGQGWDRPVGTSVGWEPLPSPMTSVFTPVPPQG